MAPGGRVMRVWPRVVKTEIDKTIEMEAGAV